MVLADLWDRGWSATVDGEPVAVLRTNHALRGVTVPAGRSEILFAYRPASLGIGRTVAGGALIASLTWWVAARTARRRQRATRI